MSDVRDIVVLTGAGISAESGVPTFRGPDGLWEGYALEEVATPEAFARDPVLVQRFHDMRRAALERVEPNAAHAALARLEADWPGGFLLVTQNIDDLHDRAGSERLIHMHGELRKALCAGCGAQVPWTGALSGAAPCGRCGGVLRPDVVWFGEMPYRMDEIDAAIGAADLFVSVGTSGAVYPAAGYVRQASHAGACTLELNLELSAGTWLFDESRQGPATALVPAWVDELLSTVGSASRP